MNKFWALYLCIELRLTILAGKNRNNEIQIKKYKWHIRAQREKKHREGLYFSSKNKGVRECGGLAYLIKTKNN